MMRWRTGTGISGVALLLLASATAAIAQEKVLTSVKTDSAPAIDGKVDEVWSKAKPLAVELGKLMYEPKNYKGIAKSTVNIRSLYDGENLYLLMEWADPTQSLQRAPWVKQADGSWKQLHDLDDTEHENIYYEDKLAMFWGINAQNFDSKGCAVACHKARGGKNAGHPDKSPGRKWTNNPGETIDMWHWKSARTNPVGQVDDQFIDDTKDPAKNKDWGRRSDAKTGGGYADNVSADKKSPGFMNKAPGDENRFWVLNQDQVPFVDTFKAGDVIGGLVLAPFAGSRGDISGKGVWANGKWTLEIKRKLVTGGSKSEDVQFSDLKKPYYFGVSVFDNTQVNHTYHEGVNKLVFN